MRILHISDLHFGAHDAALSHGLLRKMEGLKPDVIVCTGDLADGPDREKLQQAKQFISDLAKSCTEPEKSAADLIVVPGNHDYRNSGFLQKKNSYPTVFGECETEYFNKDHKPAVWIFGFNSAVEGKVGGSGMVSEDELDRFHSKFDEMSDTHGAAFENAIKIVAVHHHPLPVNWSHNFKDRWLTMTNSGRFLSAVLLRKVDLILHGHEHLQARAGFWSSLGNNDHEVKVISLGATLRKVDSPNKNWFCLITVDDRGTRAQFYPSVGSGWPEAPEKDCFEIRPGKAWDEYAASQGYQYREVASITTVDDDGDAWRVVESEDLMISKEKCDRANGQPLDLPSTSGYLQVLQASGKGAFLARVEKPIPRPERARTWSTKLIFDTPLVSLTPESYSYKWCAVNSFALDKLQFDCMYGRKPGRLNDQEFTHYSVVDPIQELTLVVRFPLVWIIHERVKAREKRCRKG